MSSAEASLATSFRAFDDVRHRAARGGERCQFLGRHGARRIGGGQDQFVGQREQDRAISATALSRMAPKIIQRLRSG